MAKEYFTGRGYRGFIKAEEPLHLQNKLLKKREYQVPEYKQNATRTEVTSLDTSSDLKESEDLSSDSGDLLEGEDETTELLNDSSTTIELFKKHKKLFQRPLTVKSYRKRASGVGKWFTILSPCISKLIFSKKEDYMAIKAMLGFPIGVLFGFILHKLVIDRLQLDPFSTQALGMILALWMGIGYATSTQVRCICFLTIPAFCGKAGRAYLSTFIITFIITGPVANIINNAKESTRVMSCIASLNYNHTLKRFKLMFKPVKEIVWDFVGAGDKIQQGINGTKTVYEEIDKEVNDEEEVKMAVAETQQLDQELGKESRVNKIEKKFSKAKDKFGSESESKYGMKSEFRCESIFNRGVKGCYNSFGAAYDRCHSYLPVVGYLLCWPMKLTFICDIASTFMGKRACDSKDALSPGFGESMDTADAVQREFDKEFGVKVHYKLEIPVEKIDEITPQDIGRSMRHQFEKQKRSLEFVLNMISRVLAFVFLLVFQSSRNYCNRYLRVIQYDNKYITSYFRHIDARRKKQGKMALLPLKKAEKTELTETFKVKFSPEEKASMIMHSMRLGGELVTVSIIVLFDWIFYELLMLIQRHAHVTYYQTGMHHIKMTVYGDGFVGTMVRSILKGFDKKHTIDEVTSTAECLPHPVKLEAYSILILYLMFILIFCLMLLESYALRLRRVICAFFYPKREKKRTLFLYNDRLKKRKSYLRFMRHRVRKMARNQAISLNTGVFFSLRHLYPKCCNWLGKLGFGRRKCLVCEEIEPRKGGFIVCPARCPFCYCAQCWRDIEEKCYVCLPGDDEEFPFTDDENNEEDSD